jgi:hypothetical protein
MEASLATNVLFESVMDDEPIQRSGKSLVLSTAEVAPCTCPEWCERDHDRD